MTESVAISSPHVQQPLLAVWSLWRRELVRFVRQRSRVVGALAPPIVFWLLMGSGFARTFRSESVRGGVGLLEYAYPGALTMIVLFTAIFSTISLIEDRNAGFLQGVLVSPVGGTAVALSKILGSATLAVGHAACFLPFAPVAGVPFSFVGIACGFCVLVIMAVGLSALGFLFAWRLDSSQGFHAVMNLVLMPMWVLSGAIFPPGGAASWLRTSMHLNPLTYGVSSLRYALYFGTGTAVEEPVGVVVALVTASGFTVVLVVASLIVVGRDH